MNFVVQLELNYVLYGPFKGENEGMKAVLYNDVVLPSVRRYEA
jgi:hypothetical protein